VVVVGEEPEPEKKQSQKERERKRKKEKESYNAGELILTSLIAVHATRADSLHQLVVSL